MTTRVEQINTALLRIGANPLQSDTAAGAEPFVAIYTGVMARLSAHPWTFYRRMRRLVQLALPPEILWAYAYQLPADRIGPPRALYWDTRSRTPLTEYDIQGDQVLCDQPQLWADIPLISDAVLWPGDFQELQQVALMAEYALSVREDRALHDRLYQKAFGSPGQNGMGGLLASCLENDAQATPATTVGGGVNPLIDVRA